MSFSYDKTNLNVETDSGRLNAVRFFLGDVTVSDAETQDEEIIFTLSQVNNSVYAAVALLARTLATKYAKLVDTEIDGQITVKYSQASSRFSAITREYEYLAKSASLGMKVSGISIRDMTNTRNNPDRPKGSFVEQFSVDRLGGSYE